MNKKKTELIIRWRKNIVKRKLIITGMYYESGMTI